MVLKCSRDWWSEYQVPPDVDYVDFVALDPGETTGMFCATVSVQDLVLLGSGAIDGGSAYAGLEVDIPSSGRSGLSAFSPFFLQECAQVDQVLGYIHRLFTRMSLARESAGVSACRVVVCEDFTLRERTSERSLLSPVRLTSMILDRLHSHGDEFDMCIQSPNDKSIISDDMLKRRGLYTAGKPHANDAARHGLLFLRKVLVR